MSNISGTSNSGGVDPKRMQELGLNLEDRRLMQTIRLIGEIIGFPRHLSQHVGGFVITRGRLDELSPIENAAMEDRTVIEWDKDDIDALGILKVMHADTGTKLTVDKLGETRSGVVVPIPFYDPKKALAAKS